MGGWGRVWTVGGAEVEAPRVWSREVREVASVVEEASGIWGFQGIDAYCSIGGGLHIQLS